MSYLVLDVAFLAVAAVVFAVALARGPAPARFALTVAVTALVLVVLTVVFDALMIRADLFRYDAAALVGLRLWRVPVEDLAWPVAAALLVPSVRRLAARATAPQRVVHRVG